MTGILALFEAQLAAVADQAISSPTGGFAAFLGRSPAFAALYVIAATSAHTYLSGLESKLVPPPPAPPRPPQP